MQREKDSDLPAFQDALDYLYNFVNYEQKMTDRYAPEKMDPSRPGRLLAQLGNPHADFPSIHIAGTKGKGSVAAMCAACLRSAGLSVGLYTSPHLREIRERIRVLTPEDADGRIPHADFAALVERLKEAASQEGRLTWFELVTAVAFMHFAEQEVDAAVVEVGLGGRLDATNVLTPLVSVITSLSLDHTGLLGDTVAAIAAEKGGIIKPGVPVVSASQEEEAMETLEEIALELRAPLVAVGREWQYEGRALNGTQEVTVTATPAGAPFPAPSTFRLALTGDHQRENAVVALAALHEVHGAFPTLDADAMRQGLATVQWPGRLQILHRGPDTPMILLDGAHNADSAAKLAHSLSELYEYDRLWLVLGVTAEKNIPGILEPLLPLANGVFATQANHPRASAPAVLRRHARSLGYQVHVRRDVDAAVTAAWEAAGPSDLICVTGSLFVVGDLLNSWDSLKSVLLKREG
ncbi:MAG: folylpolyglutamate synthase/dihydrofolate synthase family protein [Candidatus Promineifilaceae bacterium]|nr:folylpolyglutamate synthase/dihydrofolate synthase family protein [Candidatus Promineifilaceae bacterium]